MMESSYCFICNTPFNSADPGQAVIWERCACHWQCFHVNPEMAQAKAKEVACCMAAAVLKSMGGGVYRRQEEVPAGEIWLWIDKKMTKVKTDTLEEVP